MSKFSISANKSLGQHFLKNESIIETICTSNTLDFDYIIEVGPGPATLTKNLSQKEKPLFLIEKDERFLEMLQKLGEHVKVFNEDALKFEISNIGHKGNGWLVSNLPYNISVPLLFRFVHWHNIKEMTLMFQKEVGDKIINFIKTNAISLSIATQFETTLVKRLKPGAFHPPPEVDSIVLHFKRLKSPLIELSSFIEFKKFIQAIFDQKRKQIYKHLNQYFGELDQVYERLNIKRNARAQELNLEQVIGLYELWEKDR